MRTFKEHHKLCAAMQGPRSLKESIAFVPTMGNLHQGHLSLVEIAKQRAERVIVSIFVNPMQFDQAEDLANYPRTLKQDTGLLADAGVDWLFTPDASLIYPEGINRTSCVHVPLLTKILEGESREGHFDGVTTVMTKLFNLVQPDMAIFGEKDFQQLMIVRKMVEDLNLPIRILAGKIVREDDNLAMSSRNSRLSKAERKKAPSLYEVLSQIEKSLKSGQDNYRSIEQKAMELLQKQGFVPDYVSIRNSNNLRMLSAKDNDVVILGAARLGAVRLIDNIAFTLKNDG